MWNLEKYSGISGVTPKTCSRVTTSADTAIPNSRRTRGGQGPIPPRADSTPTWISVIVAAVLHSLTTRAVSGRPRRSAKLSVDIPETNVAALYDEARGAIGAKAYTAAVMCCRKLLMHIAVEKKAPEGATFASKDLVEFCEMLLKTIYQFPAAVRKKKTAAKP
jgi:hypothetical protein